VPQIDVLRPVSVQMTGTSTAVPSGTVATVTADNNDSTYVNRPTSSASAWSVRMASHTPAATYQRHQIRGRIRARTDTGTASEDIDLGRGATVSFQYTTVGLDSTFAERIGVWTSDPAFSLGAGGALADLNVGGGWPSSVVGATALRTAEVYLDVDTRHQPDFDPEVRDAAGVDRAGGTISDTATPTLFFGVPAYDDLPALDWFLSIDTPDGTVWYTSGSGVPPSSVPVTVPLANGDYTAAFTVRSTIRGADPFMTHTVLSFEMDNEVPPPSPPLLEVTEAFGGYQVAWSNPGGQEWDLGYPLVAELWRDDCTGSQRIAVIPDGLNGAYLDLAIPQVDLDPGCDLTAQPCPITYRVRYHGYISNTVEIPDVLPPELILAWPSTVASIPDGWTRVTELDGYFPRGTRSTGAPVITGGNASHSHTTPTHRHTFGAHRHSIHGGDTTGSFDSVDTRRFNGADQPTANQSHSHPLPDYVDMHAPTLSGTASPGTTSANNLPQTRDVIWIRSDGTRTAYPVGILGYSMENVSGWTLDANSDSRFLRGAAAGGNGGAQISSAIHNHTVNAHTHTGAVHDHSIDNTGLSTPRATDEAETGSTGARWLPRHTHVLNSLAASTGNLISGGDVDTASATREPRHRRLRIVRNTGGGAQTRIIGLYLGAPGDLNPILTLCDGRNGTPDMRNLFARGTAGSGGVNVVAGTDTHSHTIPGHSHVVLPHKHEIVVGPSNNRSYQRRTGGDQGSVPTANHIHTAPDTFLAVPSVSTDGNGSTNVVNHVPPYREVHFVRVDGVVTGGPLPIPELRTSEFAEVTVPSFAHPGDGLDRLASRTDVMRVVTDRSHEYPRLVVDSVPLDGGLHTVSNTLAGEEVSLIIAVEGLPAIDALETLLAADRLYWSPVSGTPGWFAPAGWTVTAPTPNVKVVQVTMVRQGWPSTPDPEEFL
jgi:hypothetical protein